jgi:hypothetical protein
MWMVSTLLLSLLGDPCTGHPARQGVRVVDAVNVTMAREEFAHALDGEEMTVGETGGRRWRSATGWFSYTLRIYEDTALTIVCAFGDTGGTPEAFDILVDGRKAATQVGEQRGSQPRQFKLNLPLAETAGKTEVTVTFRAHAGSCTARLLELRTVQEHLEFEARIAQKVLPTETTTVAAPVSLLPFEPAV